MRKLECVELAMKQQDKFNLEGKQQLADRIIQELTEEELDNFLKAWGYDENL